MDREIPARTRLLCLLRAIHKSAPTGGTTICALNYQQIWLFWSTLVNRNASYESRLEAVSYRRAKLGSMVEEAVKTIINKYLSPSEPVQQEEMLRGRSAQLNAIEIALETGGRSAFVYGVRGVGKTSLAQTAAYHFAPSEPGPLLLSCDPTTTFGRFVRELVAKAVGAHPLERRTTIAKQSAAKLYLLEGAKKHEVEIGNVPTPEGVNEAVALLEYALDVVGKGPIVAVVDEFDRIADFGQRALFGDFVKQIGDQKIAVKFLFCGVGRSLDDLLAGHQSCFRYLEGVELDRLGISPSIEILGAAAKALNLSIDDGYRYRIAQVSDGFPHYVHLIGQRMFYNYFEDPHASGEVASDHFEQAIHQATTSVEPHLRALYEKATEKYGNSEDYELVLWAAASHPDLKRKATDIYDAYCEICNKLKKPSIDRGMFNNRLNPLKDKAHGEVLVGTRQGWYEFNEPMLRGLCRLRAMAKYGLSLGKEYYI